MALFFHVAPQVGMLFPSRKVTGRRPASAVSVPVKEAAAIDRHVSSFPA